MAYLMNVSLGVHLILSLLYQKAEAHCILSGITLSQDKLRVN
jgi:hypothetical protein